MDYHFVPNLAYSPATVEAMAGHTRVPLDCHLMIEEPERWAPMFAEAGAKNVTIHAEAVKAPLRTARDLHAAGARAGIAFNPGTAVEPYAELFAEFDMALIMTIEPGFGGQPFLPHVLPTIAAVRKTRRRARPRPVDPGRRRSHRRHRRAVRRGRGQRARRRLGGVRRRRPGQGRAAHPGRRRTRRRRTVSRQ